MIGRKRNRNTVELKSKAWGGTAVQGLEKGINPVTVIFIARGEVSLRALHELPGIQDAERIECLFQNFMRLARGR